ncbi:MAG: hypothetical protein ACRDRE_23195 [Pseudonocardiaceae bacterium]
MDDLHAVGMAGPLGPYARGFAAELARLGFTRGSAQKQMGLAAHLSRWLGDAAWGWLIWPPRWWVGSWRRAVRPIGIC